MRIQEDKITRFEVISNLTLTALLLAGACGMFFGRWIDNEFPLLKTSVIAIGTIMALVSIVKSFTWEDFLVALPLGPAFSGIFLLIGTVVALIFGIPFNFLLTFRFEWNMALDVLPFIGIALVDILVALVVFALARMVYKKIDYKTSTETPFFLVKMTTVILYTIVCFVQSISIVF